ncbi:MAG: dipeptide epimerase, partial [candidate division Zixibacteria bacterium]|nr:dipeptide epimerase [candidate division Zixibacteria bacterium]
MQSVTDTKLTIASLSARNIDIPLAENFATSQGTLRVAKNIFVKITLSDGICGFGECAPFEAVTGESRAATNTALKKIDGEIVGRPVSEYRKISQLMNELVSANPAARCGVETAMLDCFCRSQGIPLWKLWSDPEKQSYITDITIPIADASDTLQLARRWRKRGFRMLKMKVGKKLDKDVDVIIKIADALSDVSFVIDANEGFSESEALSMIKALKKASVNVHLIEQPIARGDLEGMARIRSESPFPICADESASTVENVTQIIKANAADVINIKIMKSGVIESC